MKRILKYAAATAAVVALQLPVTSCIEEAQPTDIAISEQVSTSKEGLVNGINKYMNTSVSTSQNWTIGYPSMMIIRDVCTADMPVLDPSYYYFSYWCHFMYLGDWQPQYTIWNYYYKLVKICNLAIEACDPNLDSDATLLATAHAMRAMLVMDMVRMYEFMPTGTSLDSYYATLKGQTVPLVTEYTTEAMSRNNPRAPFYEAYRFILTDLNRASEYASRGEARATKNLVDEPTVNGLKARMWLELATRFERFPEDLATAQQHDGDTFEDQLGPGYALDPLNINTAVQAYNLAYTHATLAIGSYTPLTESDWYSKTTGFNSASSNSWMLAIVMGTSDDMVTTNTWQSWASFMCPEASYGVASPSYRACHMIDAALYDEIDPYDWRRNTWINPEDFEEGEEAFNATYAANTSLSLDDWLKLDAYVGMKYHPGGGNGSTSTSGNQMDIPLMRVEEMYFIQAEAAARIGGPAAGKAAIESFMNTYRMNGGTYTCDATTTDDVVREIVKQKRIEFWGEGLTYFDIRRLGIPVVRGYQGTNHSLAYRYNSAGEGFVPVWSTLFIPVRENNLNKVCTLNPDPSAVSQGYLWSE